MKLDTLSTNWPPSSSWEYRGESRIVAYFSMEIAINPAMPTYSGGLGVLAGDTLRAAADVRSHGWSSSLCTPFVSRCCLK